MLRHPSKICIHFLGSRLVGEKNPYIPRRFVEAHQDIINVSQKVKLHAREGRVWDVQIELARSSGLAFGGPGWMELFKFYNIKMGYIAVFDFINGIDEASFLLFDHTNIPVDCLPFSPPPPPPVAHDSAPQTEDSHFMSMSDDGFIIFEDSFADGTVIGYPSGGLSPTTSFDAVEEDGGAYPLSQQLRFRLASEDKKFRVSKRPRTGSIAGFKSLRIPIGFVRRNFSQDVKPSQCVWKIPRVGSVAFRFVNGLYLEVLIEEPMNDDGETVFEVMVFRSDGTDHEWSRPITFV
ncbi:hypothetical protein ACFE04_019519 [Oxalis oulophora]